MGPYSMPNALTLLACASLAAVAGCASRADDGSVSSAAAEVEDPLADGTASELLTTILTDKGSHLQATPTVFGEFRTVTTHLLETAVSALETDGSALPCYMQMEPKKGAVDAREQAFPLDARSTFTLTAKQDEVPATERRPAGEVFVTRSTYATESKEPGQPSKQLYNVEMYAKSAGAVFWLTCTILPMEGSKTLGEGLLGRLQKELDGKWGIKLVTPSAGASTQGSGGGI